MNSVATRFDEILKQSYVFDFSFAASNEASPTNATPPSLGVTSKESPMLMEQVVFAIYLSFLIDDHHHSYDLW